MTAPEPAGQDTHGTGPKRRKPPTRAAGQKLSARTIAIHRKQARAVELKAAGRSNQQIADELQYRDRSAASKAVAAALGRVDSDSVDELRLVQDQQIRLGMGVVFGVLNRPDPPIAVPAGMDAAEGRVWVAAVAAALEHRDEIRLKAVDRLGRLAERQAKLHGLDAPAQTVLSSDGAVTVVFNPAMDPRGVPQP